MKFIRRGQRALDDLDRDIREHLEHEIQDNLDRGMTPEEARRAALIQFGDVVRVKEDARAVWAVRWMEELRGDLRYAVRQLGRAPGLTSVIVLILGLGIGASTAVFSEIRDLVWKKLPVAEPDQLRQLLWRSEDPGFRLRGNSVAFTDGVHDSSFSYPAYRRLRDQTTTFKDLVAFAGMETLNVGVAGLPETASGQLVSGNYFQALGIQAAAGRLLAPEDDRRDAAPVAVLGHAFWQRVFGGDPAVVGATVRVNNTPVEIVGVMPPEFHSFEPRYWRPDLVLPISLQPLVTARADFLDDPGNWSWIVFGRLRPGVAEEQARVETEALLRQAIRAAVPSRPDTYAPPEVALVPGARGLRRTDELPFTLTLGAAVGLVLLVACANIGGLLLARAADRRREIGTRLALGAGRFRLIRQLLTESIVLTFVGGAVGVALAFLLSDSVVASGWQMLAFAVLLSVTTGIVFGLAPAVGAASANLRLRTSPQLGHARPLAREALVVVQVALSFMLLVGGGLLFRTLFNLQTQPLGFLPENLLVFRVDPSKNGYAGPSIPDFFETALDRIASVPGVDSASLSRWGLLTFSFATETVCVPGQERTGASAHHIAPRFFATMGVPLRLGRDITWNDREGAPAVVVVNETFSRRFYDEGSPIGRVVRIGCGPEADGREAEIVGVVADAKYADLRGAPRATLFIPYRQSNERWVTFAVRTTGDPAAMTPAIREAIAGLDPNLALYDVASQAEWIELNVSRERRLAHLIAAFSGVALLLSALGVYGMLAHVVSRRTPEIGLRMALGAPPWGMAAMVVRQSLPAVGLGLALGLAGAFGASRLITSMLFGVSAHDPVTLLLAVAGIALAAALAAFLPARRATRIDPMVALRCE